MESHFKFFAPVRVRYVETDMQGHVFFGNYFTYFDMGLIEYLRAVGYKYNDFLGEGVDFFMCRPIAGTRGGLFSKTGVADRFS